MDLETLIVLILNVLQLGICDECPVVKYVQPADCDGQKGTKFTQLSLEDSKGVQCSRTCQETYDCLVFFYNAVTKTCNLHKRLLDDIDMTAAADFKCFIPDDVKASWVVDVIYVTSSRRSHPSTRMIGPPDTRTWAQYAKDRNDYFEFRINSELFVTQIHIHERYRAGGVSQVRLLAPNATWYTVWSTDELKIFFHHRILSLDFPVTDFKTSVIRINVGRRSELEWIDAIQVVGKKN